jgi:hypothetical protein
MVSVAQTFLAGMLLTQPLDAAHALVEEGSV